DSGEPDESPRRDPPPLPRAVLDDEFAPGVDGDVRFFHRDNLPRGRPGGSGIPRNPEAVIRVGVPGERPAEETVEDRMSAIALEPLLVEEPVVLDIDRFHRGGGRLDPRR